MASGIIREVVAMVTPPLVGVIAIIVWLVPLVSLDHMSSPLYFLCSHHLPVLSANSRDLCFGILVWISLDRWLRTKVFATQA